MMRVVHLASGVKPDLPKKLTKRELLHENALMAVANAKIKDRERAVENLKPEYAEIELLTKQLQVLNQTV